MNKKYTKSELIKLAKRDNNKKRPFLMVNPLQGKHVPVSPTISLELFDKLTEKLIEAYSGEKFLIIGFSETATSIGAAVAIKSPDGSYYIQTTREIVDDSNYLFFTENHSHATEQKLVSNNLEEMIINTDRIVFVEDEVTTGNTIFQIKNIIENTYRNKELKFSILSILNRMNSEDLQKFSKENIQCLYIMKIFPEDHTKELNKYSYDNDRKKSLNRVIDFKIKNYKINNYVNSRIGLLARKYQEKCDSLVEKILNNINIDEIKGKKILILGTEEFMYPAMVLGKKIEKEFEPKMVKFHATTRSPILPSGEEEYPLNIRYELRSFYDTSRTIYLYNLDTYDKVIIIHDSDKSDGIGFESLISALREYNCINISIFQWSDKI